MRPKVGFAEAKRNRNRTDLKKGSARRQLWPSWIFPAPWIGCNAAPQHDHRLRLALNSGATLSRKCSDDADFLADVILDTNDKPQPGSWG
jgi:hypothetical protein